MDNNEQDRRRFFALLSACALAVALGLIAYLSAFKIMDRDFWWHLKAGELMLRTRAMIRIEPFAYTRAGQPYLATHEWLAQIVFYVVHHAGGTVGIIAFRALLVALTFVILLSIDRKNIWLNAIVAVFAANAARPGYMDRPQLFTYAIFAAFLMLAYRYLESAEQGEPSRVENQNNGRDTSSLSSVRAARARASMAGWMVALQIIWVNVHGAACLLGFAVAGAMACEIFFSDGTKSRDGRLNPVFVLEMKTFAALGAGLAVAMFISPNTYRNLTYLSQLFTDKTIAFIGEWQPRDFAGYVREIGPMWVIAVLALSFGWRSPRRAGRPARRGGVFSILMLAATGYLSRKAYRHEMLFVFAATAVTFSSLKGSAGLEKVKLFIFQKREKMVPALAAVFLLVAVHVRASYIAFCQRDNLFGIGAFDLARGAMDFVQRENIQGHMFNTYGIGGYLMYRGFPNRKVYIDGRNVDYGFEFMNNSYLAGFDPSKWKEIEDRFGLTYAFIDYDAIKEKNQLPYCLHLDVNPNWKLVYLDDWVALYLKNIPENKRVIDRFAYTQLTPAMLEYGIPSNPSIDAAALQKELERSVADSAQSVKARLALSRVYLANHDLARAGDLAQQAIDIRPYQPEAYATLAGVNVSAEKWADAGRLFEKSIEFAGKNYPNINYSYIAAVFEKAGDAGKARRYRDKADRDSGPAPIIGNNAGTVPAVVGGGGPSTFSFPDQSSAAPAVPSPLGGEGRVRGNPVPVPVARPLTPTLSQTGEGERSAPAQNKVAAAAPPMNSMPAQILTGDAAKNMPHAPTDKATQDKAKALALQLQQGMAADLVKYNDDGVDLAQAGKLDEAKEKFLTALKIDPGYAEANNNLGAIYQQQQNWPEAVTYFQRALERKPNYADAHFNLAACYYRLGKFDNAFTHATEAQALGKDTKLFVEAIQRKRAVVSAAK